MNLAIIGNSPRAEYWLVSFLVLGVEIAGEGGGGGVGIEGGGRHALWALSMFKMIMLFPTSSIIQHYV